MRVGCILARYVTRSGRQLDRVQKYKPRRLKSLERSLILSDQVERVRRELKSLPGRWPHTFACTTLGIEESAFRIPNGLTRLTGLIGVVPVLARLIPTRDELGGVGRGTRDLARCQRSSNSLTFGCFVI